MSIPGFTFLKSKLDFAQQPRLGIGVDFGTTNSAAAIFDGNQVIMVALEKADMIMPSATYIDRSWITTTGQNAIDLYIEGNAGRRVELSAEVIGEARTTTGQLDDTGIPTEADTHKVYGQSFNDSGLEGRLFRGVKRLLASSDIQRLMVFNRPFRLVALITPLLLRIRQAMENHLTPISNAPTTTLDYACIGHPVNFEGNELRHNQLALQRLSEAYQYAGIKMQTFCPEPIAATISFLNRRPELAAQTLLTVDFGGGTLDFCVLQKNECGFDVVATYGLGLGGDHIDQCIFRELLFPLLGKGEQWRRLTPDGEIETPFPFGDYENFLINWPVSYLLNQNKYTAPVQNRINQGGKAAVKFQRLYELIAQNHSYMVFEAIKDFKARLSTQETATLDIPEIDIEVTLSRTEFEAMIAKPLAQFRQAVQATLNKAGKRPEEIDWVLRTGGSSLIPAVKRILDKQFPDKVVEHDPFTSVASGLAVASYYGYSVTLSGR